MRTRAVRLLACLALAATMTGGSLAARADDETNPLAGGTWGVYTGDADGIYGAWEAASGTDKDLLAKIALRPRVRWFGQWISTADIRAKIRNYIEETQAGDPNVLIQLAVFRLWPETEAAKDKPLTVADRVAYRAWVDEAARAIGSARTVLVLEPDLAVALKGWRPRVRLNLARYAAQVFGALPRTTVYIDGSDADWLKVPDSVRMLKRAGIQYADGVALGATHYSSVRGNVRYGRNLVAALASAGYPGKRYIIDTADNGRPFTHKQFYRMHPRGNFDNAPACTSKTQKRCITLGRPPTWRFERPGLDGLLWFGRPWLYNQASPFDLQRSLTIAATTRY